MEEENVRKMELSIILNASQDITTLDAVFADQLHLTAELWE